MRGRYVVAVLVVFFGLQTARAYAQVTATWTDGTGNWSTAGNWSTNTVPNNNGGSTYDVVIQGTGSDTVTFDLNSAVVNSLALGTPGDSGSETLQNNGNFQTFTIGNLTNNDTVNWGNGARLTVGSLANAGQGIVNITGQSTLAANSIYNGQMNFDHSTLNLIGDYSVDRGGGVQLTNGSVGIITGSASSGNVVGFNGFTVDKSTLFIGGDGLDWDNHEWKYAYHKWQLSNA